MQARGMPDGRDVPRPVPGGAHAKKLAKRRHLPRRAQAADLRDVDPDEIDQAAGDQREILLLGVEAARPSPEECSSVDGEERNGPCLQESGSSRK